ncbi:uncharacterized protein LOC142987229 [Anticarsia gemmatalis]|uniref:uncharacterized protein LOC142987229 n=1 Tax=Anticarsia gemmatalis TaxID=129554 RepID=UPI003F777AC8
MGRKALLAAVCWLALSQTLGDKTAFYAAVPDNESAESSPRLYRHAPAGVYASAAPYVAYSYQKQTTYPGLAQTAASQVVPVKENYVNHLTDSYGNKFVGTPQLSGYKLAFPQQFVQLQTKLPEHLAQPLVAASANFQFKQENGQFFAPYRLPALQGPLPTPLNQFPTFGQLYGGKVTNLAPAPVNHAQLWGLPKTQQQQSTNNKAVFTNTQSHEKLNDHKNEPKHSHQKEPQIIIGTPKAPGVVTVAPVAPGETKFQKIQEVPHSSFGEPKFQRIQEAPHTHYGDVKYQKNVEAPHLQLTTQSSHESHSSHEEPKFQRVQEFPHYESKFQIIDEGPHYERIKEHHTPYGEVKFQRLQQSPPAPQIHHSYEERPQHSRPVESSHSQNKKAKLQADPTKQVVTYINDINGKKTIVELETKPTLPLLDLTLLEPLTFANPLVPQVQHFLPRINQATYQKLPELNLPAVKNYQKEYAVQKTTSYNSAEGHEKPQKEASKKKHKKPIQPNKYDKHNDVPKKTTVTYHETLDDAPEITYEVGSAHSPNYKETVKQKAVSYNKQTQSEPVHISYGSNTDKKPVTYSYSRTTKEPLQLKSNYGDVPSHLIYNFSPEEQVHEERAISAEPHHNEAEHENESSHESHNDAPHNYHEHHHTEQYKERPQSSEEHHEPTHKEKESYQKQNEEKQQNSLEIVNDNHNPPKYYSEPAHITSENINFQPILKEYQNNIRLLTAPSASIKIDPHQHVQPARSTPPPQAHHEEQSQPQKHHHSQSSEAHENPHSSSEQQRHHHQNPAPASQEHPHTSSESHTHHHHEHPSPAPQEHPHSSHETHYHHSSPQAESYNAPASHVHEKSKRIIIQEETPDEMHMLREQMRAEVIKREENSEEDFEKAYHDAALGFPAYNVKAADAEKDIFDPESYGVPHSDYNFDSTPFQQYQEEGDEFPKESRSRYKDARDKMKQNYYSEYAISKPESLLDRYQNKLGYYKLFKEQKPDYLVDDEEEDKKQNQKSAKYSVAPTFNYHSSQDKDSKSYFGHPKPKQQLYEYDYSKGTPRDSSAYASRPFHNYKTRLSFIEPQFQYGFAPLMMPKLLDSELAAMASNDSPESEKPGMRKKIYKENWYIKKTSTSGGAPAS